MRCFICGHETIVWDNDFNTQDLGIDEEGIVSYFHCSKCGANYEVVRIFEETNDE